MVVVMVMEDLQMYMGSQTTLLCRTSRLWYSLRSAVTPVVVVVEVVAVILVTVAVMMA